MGSVTCGIGKSSKKNNLVFGKEQGAREGEGVFLVAPKGVQSKAAQSSIPRLATFDVT